MRDSPATGPARNGSNGNGWRFLLEVVAGTRLVASARQSG
jgi:hypothetical protein